MVSFEAAKEFLKAQHLAPLLSEVQQQLITLNKWSTVGQALQVCILRCYQSAVACKDRSWRHCWRMQVPRAQKLIETIAFKGQTGASIHIRISATAWVTN